jgi:hypothetical protein
VFREARKAEEMNPNSIPKEQLVKDAVYRLYKRKGEGYVKNDLAVFCHIGSTGLPIFHPLGEPSFQDVFALVDYGHTWIAIYEREGTTEDKGY